MGDTDEEARAFFKRSEELHLSVSETLKEVAQLLKGLKQDHESEKPDGNKSEGSSTNKGKSVTHGEENNSKNPSTDSERNAAKTFRARFLTTEEVEEGQPNQTEEMDRLIAEYNALSEAVKDNMPYSEYCGLDASDSYCHLESVAILGATERAPLFAQPGECSLSYRKEIANY
ncbi:hypothetical protein SUGI_0907380 [Cryptomeria japonica]|nr:hypothetical protein SUGI_0907380 [Cryptomeria japonica]